MTIQPTSDGSNTVFSDVYGQTYHSTHGALTESILVFLDGSGVATRLNQQHSTCVLEVGLGTGLNFLLTASRALETNTRLEYWALEHTLLQSAFFAQLEFASCIEQPGLLEAFASWLGEMEQAPTRSSFTFSFDHSITFHVVQGDATQASLPRARFHAVYLDAFSPDVNPELWTEDFLRGILTSMEPGGCLSTYSARRMVRDNLAQAGFTVTKQPGPPGKREMVVARKPEHE